MLAFSQPLLSARGLRRFLRLGRHRAYLLQHAHEIVKEILFHDLALFVPVRDSTEINVKTLARRLNHGSIWHRHRTFHGAGEISDRASIHPGPA